MIYPIIAYGHPVLREKAKEISKDHPGLAQLIADMYETMYNAKGVGLAAPQIGKAIRLFIVDGSPMEGTREETDESMEGWKKVFINPVKIEEYGESWGYDEGCLSIPDIIEEVYREETIKLRYYDENFEEHIEEFNGLKARVIQHEYDHLEGVLFVDYLRGLRKQLVKSRLLRISKGKYSTFYPMEFVTKTK
jgi:peptide deformylase